MLGWNVARDTQTMTPANEKKLTTPGLNDLI